MSVEAFSYVLNNVAISGNAKVILLGIANHAHPDGTNAYPVIDTLARYAAVDRRTAQRNVRKLEADGHIAREGVGPDGQTRWRVRMGGGILPPAASEGGGTGGPEGAAPAPPEPSLEPSIPSSASARAQEELVTLGFGVDPPMWEDAQALLKAKRKVDGRLVSAEEMGRAAAALSEFNRQLDRDFGLGAHLASIVMRLRERPSWDAAKLMRLVQSACRVRWWEANGRSGRPPTPAVVFGNERVFEAVVQDAAAEAAGESTEQVQRRRFARRGPVEMQGDERS